jgi:type IV pilus assembly protein PilC
MPLYKYTAKDSAGKEFFGTYEDVANIAMLRQELAKMGYVLVRAHRYKERTRAHARIKQSDIVAFVYKFSEMYSAGLSITRSLETLEQQTESPRLRDIVADVRQNVETGSSLEKAFGKYSDIFSDFFVGMLEAGESGAQLAPALGMSAAYLEKRMDLRRKLRAAFAYPIIVCIVCFVVVAGLVAFVVPVFSKLYKQLNVRLPGPTQTLVNVSVWIRDYWWAIAFLAAGAAIMLLKLSKSARIRGALDGLKLRMPLFGKLNRMVVVSRFTRTFAMLASVGVSLIKALEVASAVAHNQKLTDIAKELQLTVESGNPVGQSLGNYDLFPPMITQLAISGEEVGELPQMLSKGADFLDKDIERTIQGMIVKLEPALTIIMGIIVALILMAVYLPMFDYMRHLK